ncbi:MAG: acetyl-CoA carboxylase biotin carboxyl carrier protein subunit [Ignavibacteriaceae bacterium]
MNELFVTVNGKEKVVQFINSNKVLIDGKEYHYDMSSENEFHYFLRLNKKTFDITKVVKDKNKIAILTEGNYFECNVQTKLEKYAETILAHSEKSHHKEDVVSPMPGMVLKIQKNENEEITIGEPVLILEAMKMENEVTSPYSGLLKKIYVSENTPVEKGTKLFRIE